MQDESAEMMTVLADEVDRLREQVKAQNLANNEFLFAQETQWKPLLAAARGQPSPTESLWNAIEACMEGE